MGFNSSTVTSPAEPNEEIYTKLLAYLTRYPRASIPEPTEKLIRQIACAFAENSTIAKTMHGLRRIKQGGTGRRTALFPSRKAGGTIPVESQLELAAAVCLERSPYVRNYRVQAIKIDLAGGLYAIPDFLVQTNDGEFEVHEIKPCIANLSESSSARMALQRDTLSELGIQLRILDASTLPTGLNLRLLLQQYTRGHLQFYSKTQIDLASKILRESRIETIIEAYKVLSDKGLPENITDYLQFHQVIESISTSGNGLIKKLERK